MCGSISVGNADAVVPHAQDDVGACGRGVDVNVSAARRVFDGVVQQVAEHLREPRRVRVGPERRVRQFQVNAVGLPVDGRPRRVDRGLQHRAEVDSLASHLQLVLCDPRHVEQVVGQPHQLHQLPLHRHARFLDDLGLVPGQAHDLEGTAQRRQRIAQFVGERRQELVLATVRLDQRQLGELLLGEVDADADAAVDVAVRVVKRLDVVLDVGDRPVAADDLDVVADRRAMGDGELHRQLFLGQILPAALDAIRRRRTVGRRHRDIAAERHAEQRRERQVGRNEPAIGIVSDGDRHGRRGDQRLEAAQPLPELVGGEIVDRFEARSVRHGPDRAHQTRFEPAHACGAPRGMKADPFGPWLGSATITDGFSRNARNMPRRSW